MNFRDLLAVFISSSFNEKNGSNVLATFLGVGAANAFEPDGVMGKSQELFFCHAIHNVHDLLAESIGFFHGGCFRIYANDRFSV